MQKLIPSIIVFIGGFTILSLEIVGSRILAPIVGATASVWGALLAVIIAGSACGSYIGGIMSDTRIASSKYVAGAHAVAAGWIMAAISTKNMLLTIHPVSHYGVIALLCSVGLFFIPVLLLSSTTTFLTKRTAHDIRHIGAVAGSLYAVATLGSVVGIFSMSYFIVPSLPIPSIVRSMALVVLLSGILGLWTKTYEPQKMHQ